MIYDLVRYQLVDENTSSMKRENVLLVSLGCSWGKCTFCDYQDDKSSSVLACDTVNKKVLSQVKGTEVGSTVLEVTESGASSGRSMTGASTFSTSSTWFSMG